MIAKELKGGEKKFEIQLMNPYINKSAIPNNKGAMNKSAPPRKGRGNPNFTIK